MKEQTQIAITIRVPPQWLKDLDAWRDRQVATPNRSEAIRAAVVRLVQGAK